MKKYDAIAYTDGSHKENIFTFGVLFFNTKTKVAIKSIGKLNDRKWIESNNIAGEIMGVIKAIQLCEKYRVSSILICHDYKGLQFWANGVWKTNKDITKAYKSYIEISRKSINIEFKWVKAHSNDKYNKIADKLANDAYDNKEFIKPLINIENYLRE